MNPITLVIITSSLALGTTLTFHAMNLILAWIGLEINTLAIIPLMTKTRHPRAIEAATKYFLMQATASALILFSGVMNAWSTGEWSYLFLENSMTNLMTLAIATKLGIAPLHFWLPEVLQGLTLNTGLIISTWQKLAPTIILLQISNSTAISLTLTLALLSMMTGGWGGINQTQTRKIMAFSSIAHMGWMMAALKISPQLSFLNLTFYFIMTLTLFTLLSLTYSNNMLNLASSWTKSPTSTSLILLSLLSLGGLPPFSGFLPKWLIAQEMIMQDLIFITTISLLSTLLTLFFYLRLMYTMSMTLAPNSTYSSSSWMINKKNMLATPTILTLLLLPMTPSFPILL